MNLSAEIKRQIFEFAFSDDLSRARRARLVCLEWAASLKPIIFRNLKLIFSKRREELNSATFDRLNKDASIASLVYCVEVLDWYDSGMLPPPSPEMDAWIQNENQCDSDPLPGSTKTQLMQLQALVPILPLKEFCWRARPRIPGWLLLSLQIYLPNCSMKILLRCDRVAGTKSLSKEPTIPAMESLFSLRSLKSVSTLKCLEVALVANETRLFQELQEVVKGCPRLEHLTIYAISRACEEIRHSNEVTTWPWESSASASTFVCHNIKYLSLQNFCLCHDDMNLWQSLLPWSLLRGFSFSCPSFLIRLGEKLESLVSLHLNLYNPRQFSECLRQSLSEQVKMTLIGYRHLESLETNNLSAIIDDETLKSIGARLKILRLHEDENSFVRNQRHAVTHSQIQAISGHCPRLTELAIDIGHGLNWPMETFDLVAARLGYIRHIKLNFELGRRYRSDGDIHRPKKSFPQITENTAWQIFHYIHRKAYLFDGPKCQAPTLNSMTISRGSRDRPDKPFLSGQDRHRRIPWIRRHTISLNVKPQVMGDGSENSNTFVMSCPELEVLRLAAREFTVVPMLLDTRIHAMAQGIVTGPHLESESVLGLPELSTQV